MRAELTGAEQITVETWPTKAGGKSVMTSCLQCAAAASIEGDADPFFLAPYDVAVPPQMPGRHFRVISWGMPTGLATSREAPAADMLRTMQSIPAPSNSIVPALRVRLRGSERRSSIRICLPQTSLNPMNEHVEI